ncbi:MAG: bifunctional glutamate N-acetyltransferase/amino-acid acetyltransferase ArgJ [bacterium]|nr:bifunctional glutamate N-acetyltransferase/amino-acid acetyltransferase ArgJ [bacterium]
MSHSFKAPRGFRFAGITAGIKQSGKKDLGLVLLERPGAMGGVYTKNKFPSAHVDYCRSLTPTDRFAALVVNSGNANAATGEEGRRRNLEFAQLFADHLDLHFDQVFTSSTGVIGHQLPIDTIRTTSKQVIDSLGTDPMPFAEAITTTDLTTKMAQRSLEIGGESFHILGVAKGSGMIMPNMGTMLAYIFTDAPLPPERIQELTREVADQSFNLVSVDGDSSTNDTLMVVTNNPGPTTAYERTERAILEVAQELAQMVAADGEGAEHLIEVSVTSAPDRGIAKRAVMAVLNSPLVKTAVHGQDPNWGRLMMALGNGLEPVDGFWHQPVTISIQGVPVFVAGEPAAFERKQLSQKMGEFKVRIDIDLAAGESSLVGWGCDLSREYITINADYHT